MTAEKTNRYTATVTRIEKFINRYVTFSDSQYSLPIALWLIATYIYPDFDAFPYMVITSDTKRSGKTRLAELVGFACSNPVMSGAMTPAAIYKTLAEEQPTLFFDEAETLSSESANTMRAVLNMGYRKGSVVRRAIGNKLEEYQVYGPKVFILIGDVYDTLKDRSIIIRMKRGEPKERFVYNEAQADGEKLRDEISAMLDDVKYDIAEKFQNYEGLEFLSDRDEEIWSPLFVLASVICHDRMQELTMSAVDMSAEKQQAARAYVNLLGEEQKQQDSDDAERLVEDMITIIGKQKHIPTAEAIVKLHEIVTAPWRKYKGVGISMHNVADILSRFGVRPCNLRIGKKIVKGYKLADLKRVSQKGGN